jgi:hypothetical protein
VRWLAVLAVPAVLASCTGSGDPGGSPAPFEPHDASAALAALCGIRGAEDPAEAEAAFVDRAHAFLHELADALLADHPDAAARVLERKEIVEGGLAAERLPEGFADDVDALLDASRDGLEALGVPAPPCG